MNHVTLAPSMPAQRSIKIAIERIRYFAYVALSFRGIEPRECSCCGYQGRFLTFGHPPRYDALCPECRSLERHRLLSLCERSLSLFGEKDVLDFAARDQTAQHIIDVAKTYVTADLYDDQADHRENIERMSFADESFDVVVCSHVLEHVDDSKALRELQRILRPGGRLLVMVPVIEGWAQTYENPYLVDRRERTLHFGQKDHVRYYGRNVRDRIITAGFDIAEFTAEGAEAVKYALLRGEKVFICKRR